MTSGERRIRPRRRPRQVRAELTRQRILTAAAHVFAEHGYAAGTTNRIAERARVSIGSLYQYYPNKDAILVELMTRHLDAGLAAIERRKGERLPDSLEEIARVIVRTAVENHLDDPDLLRVLFEQAPRSDELLERITRHERARVAYIRELFDRHPEVRVADTHTAARLVVATVEIVVHQLIAAPDPIDISRLEPEMVAMITRYLTCSTGTGPGTHTGVEQRRTSMPDAQHPVPPGPDPLPDPVPDPMPKPPPEPDPVPQPPPGPGPMPKPPPDPSPDPRPRPPDPLPEPPDPRPPSPLPDPPVLGPP